MKAGDKDLVTQPVGVLPVQQRLALAYATRGSRAPLTLLFALDQRLASIVRNSREPMLAQLRLAWWRESLAGGAAQGGRGADPLLALVSHWSGPLAPLAALADGWEGLTGSAPLPQSTFVQLAEARAGAFAALAPGEPAASTAHRMGLGWALVDIAAHLSDPRERETVLVLARSQNWRWQRLPRGLRPLAVLHGLAAQAIRMETPVMSSGPGMLLRAMRIGLTGR